jgi:hypothetical protein
MNLAQTLFGGNEYIVNILRPKKNKRKQKVSS